MRARHPRIPTQWLMTDERMGDALWEALERVPRGGGVIFRHYSLDVRARRALFQRVMRVTQRRRLMLIAAGTDHLGPHGAGRHGRVSTCSTGVKSWPAHNLREVIAAQRARADIVLISPVFATRSHPGQPPLGLARATRLARQTAIPAIALGGIDQRKFRRLKRLGFHGWAGIDAWL